MRKNLLIKFISLYIICLFVETSIGISENKNEIYDNTLPATENVQTSTSFTIVTLPDTQHYSESYPEIFTNQTQWIVDNKETLNIVYVCHEGDIVNKPRSLIQWRRARMSMKYLENPLTTNLPDGIPFSVTQGNHDVGIFFDLYFGIAHFRGRSYYGGHYQYSNQNNYVLFDVGDFKYISISLSYNPNVNELHWAENILQTYSKRKAIIVSHSILDNQTGDWTTSGLNIYNTVKKYSNVFLMLCGHNHYEARRTDTYNGTTIHTLLADYQDYPNGGNGWLRIMEFNPVANKIEVKTYSTFLNQYQTDPDSEFTLFYNQSENQLPPMLHFEKNFLVSTLIRK